MPTFAYKVGCPLYKQAKGGFETITNRILLGNVVKSVNKGWASPNIPFSDRGSFKIKCQSPYTCLQSGGSLSPLQLKQPRKTGGIIHGRLLSQLNVRLLVSSEKGVKGIVKIASFHNQERRLNSMLIIFRYGTSIKEARKT